MQNCLDGVPKPTLKEKHQQALEALRERYAAVAKQRCKQRRPPPATRMPRASVARRCEADRLKPSANAARRKPPATRPRCASAARKCKAKRPQPLADAARHDSGGSSGSVVYFAGGGRSDHGAAHHGLGGSGGGTTTPPTSGSVMSSDGDGRSEHGARVYSGSEPHAEADAAGSLFRKSVPKSVPKVCSDVCSEVCYEVCTEPGPPIARLDWHHCYWLLGPITFT